MKNIYAYTEPGSSLPAFVSLNIVDGKHIFSVRSRGTDIPATIELEVNDLENMATNIFNYLYSGGMPERVVFSEPNEASGYEGAE